MTITQQTDRILFSVTIDPLQTQVRLVIVPDGELQIKAVDNQHGEIHTFDPLFEWHEVGDAINRTIDVSREVVMDAISSGRLRLE